MAGEKFTSVDEYIAAMDPDIQPRLNDVRAAIRSAAPGAEERISYNIPAYRLEGHYLIHYSAAKAHIGLYPATAEMRKHFGDRLEPLISGKATISLKHSEPLPLDLIREIVEFQISEYAKRAK